MYLRLLTGLSCLSDDNNKLPAVLPPGLNPELRTGQPVCFRPCSFRFENRVLDI